MDLLLSVSLEQIICLGIACAQTVMEGDLSLDITTINIYTKPATFFMVFFGLCREVYSDYKNKFRILKSYECNCSDESCFVSFNCLFGLLLN